MKVSLKHLEMVVSKLKYEMLGYDYKGKDLDVEVSFTKEDPGNGSMVDCLTLKCLKPNDKQEDTSETTMSVEIYPASEKQDPVASKTHSFKISKEY